MKKMFLLLILIVLSGCSVTANIQLNNDSTMDESINVAFNNSLASNYDSPEEYAKSYLDYYNSAIKYRNYEYDFLNQDDNISYVNFTKNNKSVCDSIKYSLFSQYLYETIECNEDDYYIIIKSRGNQLVSQPQNKKVFNVEKVILNIKLPISAEENNADYMEDYVYTWKYDEKTAVDKNIYLKINKTTLEQNKLRIEEEKQQNKTNNTIIIIVGIVAFIILIVSISFVLYKKYKNNQIEY